jgi:hypothetical protein
MSLRLRQAHGDERIGRGAPPALTPADQARGTGRGAPHRHGIQPNPSSPRAKEAGRLSGRDRSPSSRDRPGNRRLRQRRQPIENAEPGRDHLTKKPTPGAVDFRSTD